MDFKLQIYRNGAEHLLVNIDRDTIFSQVIMGEHLIRAVITSDGVLDIQEGDYIMRGVEQFTLNRPFVPLDKESNSDYTYTLEFEGYVYDLRDMPFMHLGALEFSLYLKPADLVDMIVENMNTISSGWSRGLVDDLPEQNVDFYESGKGFTCKGALIKIADQFKLEFSLTGKTINLTKEAGIDTPIVFSYGRGNGLYKIVREAINDQDYFNRLIVQGGTSNIPYTYRNGAKRLRLEESYLEVPLTGGKKRRVGSVVLDDIFPHRTGTVTSVSADYLEITDTSIDFDIEGQRIEGEEALIKFTTGENAGRSFKISEYKHATKTLTIDVITEADGYVYPNATYEIKAGDKYVFLGIIMPVTYVTAAETKLREEGLIILNKAVNAIPPYRVFADAKFMRDNGVIVNAGDRVRIVDEPMGVDLMVRTSGVKFPLVEPYEQDLTISEVIPLHPADKAAIDIKKTETKVVATTKVRYESARQATKSLNKLSERVFDPDGTLAGGPATLRAAMAIFGFDSTNFGLIGVTTTTNVGGDPNRLTISSGQLMHNVYEIAGIGFTWNMSAADFTGLNPAKFYYVYAKCSKNSLVGTWQISDTPITVSQFDGYWAFNTGQLSEVNDDDWRPFNFTKGVTWIVGNQIFTGRVQDLTKRNFFDLDTGQFNLGDDQYGLDWDVSNPNRLTIKGGIVQNAGGHQSALGVFRGLYSNITVFYPGDTTNHEGSLWRYIYPTPIFNIAPTEGVYWSLEVAKGGVGATGSAGAALVSRGQYDHGKIYIGSSIRVDVVQYGSLYYFTKRDAGEFSGILPTDTSKWTPAGAQFESVATNLLLANLAYIENLGVRYLTTSDSGKRIEVSGDENNIKFFSDGVRKILIDDDAAIIGYNIIGGVVAPVYGAGMIIGSLLGNFSSISEKAVQTVDLYAKGTAIIDKYMKAQSIGTTVGSGSGNLASVGLTLANGNCSLHDYPFDGQIQRIKNTTNGSITLSTASGATDRKMYDLANNLVNTMTLDVGDVWEFQYYQTGNIWVQTGYNH